ncbi:hypothetical protein G6O67_004075 [Ophiocordyceps sinensis]|uniref:NADH dehydrogenase [ubiquinone] 1 beta subcomplex subunit 2 n=1 Tax=Ophiocordyceps sinensis TaxID=72228 RepID=A0A8H4PND6_9HYPO|nr:hypothetical protein G6O67_004075 [Ophiocordyceps sinensis]
MARVVSPPRVVTTHSHPSGDARYRSTRANGSSTIVHTSADEPRISTAMGPPKPPVPHVAPIYRLTATALGAGMWFWIMYRAKKDGPVILGWKHPWDH